MRKLLILLALALCACSDNLTREELAALAAKGYYTHLAAGEYEHFLEGKAGSDSLPDDYRSELMAVYRQFHDRQQRDHGGISEVRVSTARTDSLLPYTNAFLILCFADSLQEEIVVPMVELDGRWKMK